MSTEQYGVNFRPGRSGRDVVRCGLVLALAATVLTTASPARAVDYSWINPGTTGQYLDGANWLPGGGPTNNFFDSTTFNLPDANGHTVNFPAATVFIGSVRVLRSDVLFSGEGMNTTTYDINTFFAPNAVEIGSSSGASLTIREMTVTSVQPVRIGIAAGETGSLTTTRIPNGPFSSLPSQWVGTSRFIVGDSGTGTLTHGGSLLEARSLMIGQNSGSMGTVTSTGFFYVSGDITVADAGTATMDIAIAEPLTSENGYIGKSAGSSGTGVVRNWNLSDSLYVGGSDLAAGGTGVLNVISNGTVNVAQDMTIWAGGTVSLSSSELDVVGQLTVQAAAGPNLTLSGTSSSTSLRVGTLAAAPNSIDWQAGTIEINNGDMDIGAAGNTVTIDLGMDLTVSNTLRIGSTSTNTLTLDDGTGAGLQGGVTANQIVVGDQALSSGTVDILGPASVMTATGNMTVGNAGTGQVNLSAGTLNTSGATLGTQGSGMGTVALTGASTLWSNFGTVTIGSAGTGVLTLGSGASLLTNVFQAASGVGSNATITVDDPGTSWATLDSMQLGGSIFFSGGSGTMTVNDGSVMVGGTLRVFENFTLDVNGGSVSSAMLDVLGVVNRTGGSLDASSSDVVIRDSGAVNGDLTGNPSTVVTIEGPGGTWMPDSDVLVSGSASGTNTVGSLNIAGGTVVAPLIDLGDQPFSGSGALTGKVRSSDSITATGDLSLGDSSVINALNITGSIDAGTHTITLNQLGFFGLGTGTNIGTGGTLAAPNGMVLQAAHTISAAGGALQGPFNAQAGSTIFASSTDVSIGDASASDGYFSDGVLMVKDGVNVILLDANEAVLGSRTVLGDPGAAGSSGEVSAGNGAVLEFGKNVEGFGTVNTPNDPLKPLINNGSIVGNSGAEPITLTGYIKGVGTLDNVVITGTDAPGFSIATVSRGSVTYAGTMEIELAAGGLDTINHIGTATLGGILDISLISGFTPGLGDTFQFLTAANRVGTFASITGASLGGGLAFDVMYGVNNVTLEVINALTGDLDGDGFVGINDLNIVLANWNQNVPPANPLADPSGDGFIGIDDLNAVLGNWNAGTPPNAAAVIPEPTTLTLLTLGVFTSLRRQRH